MVKPLGSLLRSKLSCIIYVRDHIFFRCDRIFNMKTFSSEDIHLAHFGLPVGLLESLTDHQITIVFQPTACASPAGTKTNRRSDDRLGTLEVQLAVQSVPNGCPHWKMTSC